MPRLASVNNSVNTRPIPEGPKTCVIWCKDSLIALPTSFTPPTMAASGPTLAGPNTTPIRPIVWPPIVSATGVISVVNVWWSRSIVNETGSPMCAVVYSSSSVRASGR